MTDSLFKERLKRRGLRLTNERLQLFDILNKQTAPRSINYLVRKTAKHMDESTVYRNLDVFEKAGITTRVYSGWKYSVELSADFSSHHHHMTCKKCGKIIPFDDTSLIEKELAAIARNNNFRIKDHIIELSGQCLGCSNVA